jgi:hypothetical protein
MIDFVFLKRSSSLVFILSLTAFLIINFPSSDFAYFSVLNSNERVLLSALLMMIFARSIRYPSGRRYCSRSIKWGFKFSFIAFFAASNLRLFLNCLSFSISDPVRNSVNERFLSNGLFLISVSTVS